MFGGFANIDGQGCNETMTLSSNHNLSTITGIIIISPWRGGL
jgi:hypothetical protein